MRIPAQLAAMGLLLALPACDGPQSALSSSGADAIQLEKLFYVMLAGAVVLWLLVNGLIFYVTRINRESISSRLAHSVIVGGGIVLPVTVLTALVVYGLAIMPDQRAPGDGLVVKVHGEQWWWRVEYWPEGATEPVISANEVRLPANRRSEIALSSERVIHSFWVPALGGKTDMFPGRATRMSLEPLRPGVYRGQCAEFCGESHALMAFNAVVHDEDEFARWLQAEAAPAAEPQSELAQQGKEIFGLQGCGACHAVRGTEARGGVGPDLTHLASRTSLAAGILPMETDALIRWIENPDDIKPGVEMPAYNHLSREELVALAAYLESLE